MDATEENQPAEQPGPTLPERVAELEAKPGKTLREKRQLGRMKAYQMLHGMDGQG